MATLATAITRCKECDSTDLAWQTSIAIRSGVQQNRLNTNDVECLFILGCNHCSETLSISKADEIVEAMNSQLEAANASSKASSNAG